MTPTYELLERVRGADPLPDVERLSAGEWKDADELLARLLAEPLESGARRKPARRRYAVAAAGAACTLAVAFGAVGLVDDQAPTAGVVDKAVAAVTDSDAVFHVIQVIRFSGAPGDEDPFAGGVYSESWHAPDGSMHSKRWSAADGGKGAFLGELAQGPTEPDGTATTVFYDAESNTLSRGRVGLIPNRENPAIDPAADPGETLRRLENEGRLRLAGETVVDGRNAYRLVSGGVPGAMGSVDTYEYLVDAETYYPLSLRYVSTLKGKTRTLDTRFLTYERLPWDDRADELLKLAPHPGARG